MQEITIKGIKQLYVTKNEVIPMTLKENDIPIWYIGGMPKFMQNYIRASNDVRAIVTLTYDQSAFVQYVYWYFQDVNLDELDRKVTLENSGELEQYFNNIAVVDYQRTCCFNGCKKCFHTLRIQGVSDYHADNRKALENQHIQILDCPNCGKSFRQPVIKIMGEFVENPDSALSTPHVSEASEQTESGFDAEEIFKTIFDEFFQNRKPKDSD